MSTYPKMTPGELRQAFDNFGKQHLPTEDLGAWYEIYQGSYLNCGGCAGLFFTGYGAYQHDDACLMRPWAEDVIVEVKP